MKRVLSFCVPGVIAVLSVCSLTAAVEPKSATQPAPVNAKIHVTLVPAAGTSLKGEGFVVFRSHASAKPVVIPTKLPGSAMAELPAGSQWQLISDFPGYFAATSVVQAPQKSTGITEVSVTLRPAGTLTGKLILDGKEKLPDRLEARFEPTREARAKKQDIPAGVATCAVGPTGDWRCRVPAGRLDIALHPGGFVPHYLWNLSVTAGGNISLGSLKLLRGASIAGWVTRDDGSPAEKCRVRLEPATAPGRPNDPVLEFLRTVASEVPCQKTGFFQFAAVAPGSYAISAQENGAQAQMWPVDVWNGAESRLTLPIVLRRPADFEVTLSPPTDWLGRPWRVEARRANEYKAGWEESSFRTEATSEGRALLPKRAPGRFWITIYDQLGNSVFSDQHVDLSDPLQPYPITLDLFWVEGSVHLGDQAVKGRLYFGGKNGPTKIEMTSDADGRFTGPLPKPGTWRVDILGEEPRLKTSARVEVKPKGDRASVVIELPDTKVYGRVVDPSGKPASNAEVTLSSMVSNQITTVDDKGEFEIRAFPKGTTELSAERAAEGGTEVSDTYRFEASDDTPHGPVVLTLRRSHTLRGKVLAPTGPVIGATVTAWPTQGGNGVASTARSRLDGSFELKVPMGTDTVRAIVSPPGGALKAYELNVSSENELLFQVEQSGGEVVITTRKNEPVEGRVLAVWQDNIGIPFGVLAGWMESHGARFDYEPGSKIHIPQLAPGNYTVCLGAAAMVPGSEIDAWKGQASCASGYLAPSAALDLRLP